MFRHEVYPQNQRQRVGLTFVWSTEEEVGLKGAAPFCGTGDRFPYVLLSSRWASHASQDNYFLPIVAPRFVIVA